MPSPLSMAKRQSIVAACKKGEKISKVACQFKVSRQTIYNLINLEASKSSEGLQPRYSNCGKTRPDADQFIYRAVRCMRSWHPGWGAEKIHAEIRCMRPGLKLPHHRTFTRWFNWNNQIVKALCSTLPNEMTKKAMQLHEIWQIDAKEEMVIGDGSKNCWLNIVDEYSGTVIHPLVFSHKEDQ